VLSQHRRKIFFSQHHVSAGAVRSIWSIRARALLYAGMLAAFYGGGGRLGMGRWEAAVSVLLGIGGLERGEHVFPLGS